MTQDESQDVEERNRNLSGQQHDQTNLFDRERNPLSENIVEYIQKVRNELEQYEEHKKFFEKKRKREIILELIDLLKEYDYPKDWLRVIISQELGDYISTSYIEKILAEKYPEDKKNVKEQSTRQITEIPQIDGKIPIGVSTTAILSKKLESLELELFTIKANDAESLDQPYVNIVFSDGTRLYEPENLPLQKVDPLDEGILPPPGQTRRYKLPFKERFPDDRPLDRTLGDIAEVYLRKARDDAWFAGSVLLYANTDDPNMPDMPPLGNSKINQFLDNDDEVLFLRDWSTQSFSVAPATNANIPLTRSGYRVLGPVIGQISDISVPFCTISDISACSFFLSSLIQ
jgi:hypothetical protein